MNTTNSVNLDLDSKMTFWQKKLKAMPGPSPVIILLDLFFILLVIFMMSSNFVFLPGVKSVSLPPLENAEIIQANKLIVTVSEKTDEARNGEKEYTYSFNGQTKDSREKLESAVREALNIAETASANRNPKGLAAAPMIVLRAEKQLPMEELINFYSFARKLNVQLFFVTDFEKKIETTRMMQQPGDK